MNDYLILHNEQETLALGQVIGSQLINHAFLKLTGDLGAGKTTLTKGIALGLGIQRVVKSPTYTLIKEYPGPRLNLYHMDMYRLEGTTSLGDLGLEDYFQRDGVVVMEWSQFVPDLDESEFLEIFLEPGLEEGQRKCRLQAQGPIHSQVLAKIERSLLDGGQS